MLEKLVGEMSPASQKNKQTNKSGHMTKRLMELDE
jgi:hypothetical protein